MRLVAFSHPCHLLPLFATMLQYARLSHCNSDQSTMNSDLTSGADGKPEQPDSRASLLDGRTLSRD